MNAIRVLFIVGPTASGKSALALQLAQKFEGEIVNGDSVQVYTPLNIGTAKPSRDERMLCPHHLFDLVEAGGTFNANEYRKAALSLLEKIATSNPSQPKLILVVGGSGFYIQALVKGMYDVPEISSARKLEIQNWVLEHGLKQAYHFIQERDPVFSAKISPNDSYRIQRALEILFSHEGTISSIQSRFQAKPFPYPHRFLGVQVERTHLRSRVEARTHQMLRAGLVEECRGLVERGYQAWPPLQSVGYKECLEFLEGKRSEDSLASAISTSTMQLAKRQMTWFKRDPQIHWLDAENAESEATRLIASWIL